MLKGIRLMTTEELLDKFGPCGLLCEKCFAYDHGQIRILAEQLKKELGYFDNYANRFTKLLAEPRFENYPEFKEFLDLLACGTCRGCRKQNCALFKDCRVKQCTKQKKLDFCFQCADFPCRNTGFDENLEARWIDINERILDIGLLCYYHEIKDKSRY